MEATRPMSGDAPALAALRLDAGVFTADLVAAGPPDDPVRPEIQLTLDGRLVGSAETTHVEGRLFRMRARLPRECLSDGDVAIVFQDRRSGAGLATYLVSSGYPDLDDTLASIAMLRTEFEALKRAVLTEAWHEKIRAADRPQIIAEVLEAVEAYLAARDADDAP